MWNQLAPHPCEPDKIGREVSGAKRPSPTIGPQPRVPVTGREVAITSGCKNQQGLRLWKTETAGTPGSSS